MQLLHETPVITRAQLRTVLDPSPINGVVLPGPFGALSAADLADQVELIKVTPVFLNTEELSKMWAAMQSRYRPSMAYMVSVVLIQQEGGARVAPPVLKQGGQDRGPVAVAAPSPNLTAARPAASEQLPAVRLGEDVVVSGANLGGAGVLTARFESARPDVLVEGVPTTPTSSGNGVTVHLRGPAEDADAMSRWAVGVYTVSLRVTRPGAPPWTTNGVPIALAPQITCAPLAAAAGDIGLVVSCTPRLRPEQEARVSLIFGSTQVSPESIATPANLAQPTKVTFTVPGVTPGSYLVRLRVDGIDSVPVTLTGSPPKLDFDPQQRVVVA
jgi:hypothetical protein